MNTPLRRSGMARVLKGSHSSTCTPCIHPLTEWTIPAFAFPAEAGTHLPTPEGWKAELALSGWLVTYWNRCRAPGIEPNTVNHLSANRVRRRLTSFYCVSHRHASPELCHWLPQQRWQSMNRLPVAAACNNEQPSHNRSYDRYEEYYAGQS